METAPAWKLALMALPHARAGPEVENPRHGRTLALCPHRHRSCGLQRMPATCLPIAARRRKAAHASHSERYPRPPGPPAVVALALAGGDRAGGGVGARRAGGDAGGLAGWRARAPGWPGAQCGAGRVARVAVRGWRGIGRAGVRPPCGPPWAQDLVSGDAGGVHGGDIGHRIFHGLCLLRGVPLPDGPWHRRRVRGHQLGHR